MQSESQEWFLGSVEFDVTKEKFTRLRPLARAALNGSGWKVIGSELLSLFPTRGQVCWFDAREELRAHRLVEFQVAEVSKFDGEKRPEKFQAVDVTEAVEVIEWPTEDETRLREILRGRGVHLRLPPAGRTIFKLSEDLWIGPFSLVPIDIEHWGLPTDIDCDTIPFFNAPIGPFSTVRVDGISRAILRISGKDLTSERFLNWQSDVDVLRSALKRLHKLDLGAFKSAGLTYGALDAYLAAVETAGGLPPLQLAKEHARARRIQQLRHDLPMAPQLVEEIVSALESFGVVEEHLRKRCKEIEEQLKAEIAERLVAENTRLQELTEANANKIRESGDLERQLQKQRQAVGTDLIAVDEAMQGKLRQLKEAPAEAVADIVASSAIFSALLPSASPHGPHRARIPIVNSTGEAIDDIHAVTSRVTTAITRAGIDPSSVVPLLAAMLGGILPICCGAAAAEAIHSIGRSLCAGNAWTLPISPVTTSLSDILMPGGRGIAGLQDLIASAHQNPNEMFLAIIQGVNLGACEGFLLPLIALADRDKSQRIANIPLCSDTAEICSWPDNLLAVATAVDARITLPLPRRTWEYSPLFLFEWLPIDAASLLLPDQQPSRMSGTYWRELCARVEFKDQAMQAMQQINPPTRRLANRLHAAINSFVPGADATALVRTHILAPAIASSTRELPADFSSSDQSYFNAALALISETPDRL